MEQKYLAGQLAVLVCALPTPFSEAAGFQFPASHLWAGAGTGTLGELLLTLYSVSAELGAHALVSFCLQPFSWGQQLGRWIKKAPLFVCF